MMNKRKTKRSPFNSLYTYNIPEEDIQKQNKQFEIMKELGIEIPGFGSSINKGAIYTEDELKALEYIYNNETVPEDLRQRLINRERKPTTKPQKQIILTDEHINNILGEE